MAVIIREVHAIILPIRDNLVQTLVCLLYSLCSLETTFSKTTNYHICLWKFECHLQNKKRIT